MKKALQSSRDVIIQVDDWTKALEFYGTTLGFPVSHRTPDIVGFETGAFCLYVEKGNRPGPVFDFLVSDAQDTKDRLLAAGCTIIEENPAVPRCYIRDPFGVVFNIEQTENQDYKPPPNQPVRPTALMQNQFSAIATTRCRGISSSR